MNRRQFLKGVSAGALTAAMPAASVLASSSSGIDLASSPDITIVQLYYAGRYFWIGKADQVVHFSEPCDPGFISIKSLR